MSQIDGSISTVIEKVYNGPELNLGRNKHVCGIIQNEGEISVVVVGGLVKDPESDTTMTRLVECLDVTNGLPENSEQRYIPNIIKKGI